MEDDPEDFKEQLKLFVTIQNEREKKLAAKRSKPHPYYTEAFGLAAKKIVDLIATTKNNYSVKLKGGNPVTAKIQWYQGCRYLKDKLDPDKIYAAALQKIGCRQEHDQLTFYIKTSVTPDLTLLAPTESAPWKDDFLLWLDKPNKVLNEKFPCPPVTLSDADIQWANQQMAGLESVYLFKFTEHEVIVIRYDSQQSQ